ncbi:MAG: hypothetical protein IPK00_24320 [Deltaproteobacteria bacterium]|nr:hypothetical protein [Deltaproteobacteria bacterium]
MVVLEGTTFTQAFDGSASVADWVAADLDAFTVPELVRFPTLAAAGLASSASSGDVARRKTPAIGSRTGFDSAAKRASKSQGDGRPRVRVGVRRGDRADVSRGLSVACSDGVLEINQTCATLSGCFAGDCPDFP